MVSLTVYGFFSMLISLFCFITGAIALLICTKIVLFLSYDVLPYYLSNRLFHNDICLCCFPITFRNCFSYPSLYYLVLMKCRHNNEKSFLKTFSIALLHYSSRAFHPVTLSFREVCKVSYCLTGLSHF